MIAPNEINVTFDDVAGADEAKEEADESENSDEDSQENNNSHAEAIENNTEA